MVGEGGVGLDIERTDNPTTTTIQNVGINHCRLHIGMTQKLLHCADVVAVLEEVGGGRCDN
jgi:hypothetical protein